MPTPDQDLLDKLSFWHKLEFFIPFNLKDRAQEQDYRKKFWRSYHDISPIIFATPPDGMEVAGYTLFVGVFDKSEIEAAVPDHKGGSENDDFENEQGADLEGETCMASIGLSADGVPIFDDFQISTLPWALGRSRTKGVSSLSSEAFNLARARLQKELYNFSAKREEKHHTGDGEDVIDLSLAPSEVDNLIDLLAAWSGFRPGAEQPAALLEVRLQKKRPPKKEETSDVLDTADDSEEEPIEIGILNSFYIEDIESAMDLVKAGDTPTALRQYLSRYPKTNA